jgi:hypothetical protein
VGEKRNAYRILVGEPVRDHSEDLDEGGMIILKWILDKQDGVVWTILISLRIGTTGGLL